jgi:hypothetical protein
MRVGTAFDLDIIYRISMDYREENSMKISVFYHHVRMAAEQQGVPLEEMMRRVKALGVDYLLLLPILERGVKQWTT